MTALKPVSVVVWWGFLLIIALKGTTTKTEVMSSGAIPLPPPLAECAAHFRQKCGNDTDHSWDLPEDGCNVLPKKVPTYKKFFPYEALDKMAELRFKKAGLTLPVFPIQQPVSSSLAWATWRAFCRRSSKEFNHYIAEEVKRAKHVFFSSKEKCLIHLFFPFLGELFTSSLSSGRITTRIPTLPTLSSSFIHTGC